MLGENVRVAYNFFCCIAYSRSHNTIINIETVSQLQQTSKRTIIIAFSKKYGFKMRIIYRNPKI